MCYMVNNKMQIQSTIKFPNYAAGVMGMFKLSEQWSHNESPLQSHQYKQIYKKILDLFGK